VSLGERLLSLSASSAGLNSRTQIICVNRGNEFFRNLYRRLLLFGGPLSEQEHPTHPHRPTFRKVLECARDSAAFGTFSLSKIQATLNFQSIDSIRRADSLLNQ
jgi:hypothetical protein